MFEIIDKRELCDKVYQFKIRAQHLAKKAKAGQFVILRKDEMGERVPMSIGGLDPASGVLTVVIQEVGKTSASMNRMKTGDHFADVVGPLGIPSHIEKFGHCVCIGGGVGIPPIRPIAQALKEIGNKVTTIIGSRTKDLLIFEQELREASHELLISTDDGSYGTHGFVTTILQKMIDDGGHIDMVIAIGPVPMMKAVVATTREPKIKTYVSLNPIMVDGTGMCGACRVTVGGKTRFACVDGPDFDGHEVDFDEMTKRMKMYVRYEKQAYDRFLQDEHCRLAKAAEAPKDKNA
ncbi:MAG: sulfide/dihydroorotate dehydrogenase-like FAD/NAD-binding protein [Candidatus Zixiibacteriota bacterium]|nr:MAG: sulfide/dihydroorotate dehydrogenase-like FAD/NAD-binding protein [candidate division Zixibacteria bacterium]